MEHGIITIFFMASLPFISGKDRGFRRLLSGHQPVYLPGIILFNKIAASDIFMFVGHCQYAKKSWQSRNRIRLHDEEFWLTVPVKTAGHFEQAINNTEILGNQWKRKHVGSIRQAYQHRPFFSQYFPAIEAVLLSPHATLGDLNIALIKQILDWLGIITPIVDSREYDIRGNKTDMLISMCEAVGADAYLSNEGSRAYVNEKQMAEAGIQHCWQVFTHPIYDQGANADFLPYMSVIDLMFNLGPVARELVPQSGFVEPGKLSRVTTHSRATP